MNSYLLACNRRGLIAAPCEPREAFLLRCAQALTQPHLTGPLNGVKGLFDIEPGWVEIIYSNEGLRFWEAACTWQDQEKITLQLNQAFKKQERYFGYSRDEVIAHELVHVARGLFDEPIFEEILAYQTSSFSFRRLCAPIFRTPKESLFFMCLLGFFTLSLFVDIFVGGMLGILLGGVAAIIIRLAWTQRRFSQARKRLEKIVGVNQALAVMLRLTDQEILSFSKMSTDAICAYAHQMAATHIRWQQITLAYF